MSDYFLNADVTFGLLQFLDITTLVYFTQLNSFIRHLILEHKLYSKIVLSRNSTDLLKCCYQMGLVNILQRLRSHCQKHDYPDALKEAIKNNQLTVLDWLQSNKLILSYNENILNGAAKRGYLDVFHWFLNNGYPLIYTNKMLRAIAKGGQVVVLDWLVNNHYQVACNQWVTKHAILGAHTTILDWFTERHYPLSGITNARAITDSDNVLMLSWLLAHGYLNNVYFLIAELVNEAAKHDRLEVLHWLELNHFNVNVITKKTINDVVSNGYLSILQWIESHCTYFRYSDQSIDDAIGKNHLTLLDWIIANKHPFDYSADALDTAFLNGHFTVMEWFQKHQYPLKYTAEAVRSAARDGRLDILEQFKLDHYFIRKKYKINEAFEHEQLAVFEWFKSNEYTLACNQNLIDRLIKNNRVVSLEWLRLNQKMKMCKTECLMKAATRGHLSVLKWAKSHQYLTNCEDWHCIYPFNKTNNLAVIEWMINNGYRYLQNIVVVAAQRGYASVLQWALARGYPFNDVYHLLFKAIKHGQLVILNWCLNHRLFKCSIQIVEEILETAIAHNQVTVLEWCKLRRLPIVFSMEMIDKLHQDPVLLNWFKLNDQYHCNDAVLVK